METSKKSVSFKGIMITFIIIFVLILFSGAESLFDKFIEPKLVHVKGLIPICLIIASIIIFYLVLAPKKK